MSGLWADLLADLVLITFGVLIAAIPSHIYTGAAIRRQARQERMYKLEDHIRDLETLGIRYWLLEGSDPGTDTIASEIKRTRARIGREIERLVPKGAGAAAIESLTVFTQAITDGEFEVHSRAPEDRTERIGAAADALVFEVRDYLHVI